MANCPIKSLCCKDFAACLGGPVVDKMANEPQTDSSVYPVGRTVEECRSARGTRPTLGLQCCTTFLSRLRTDSAQWPHLRAGIGCLLDSIRTQFQSEKPCAISC